MLLHYVGENVEDTVFDFSAEEGDQSYWPSLKFKLGLDFPNMPYYINGDVKLTQSTTILRYLGKKYNMMGKNDEEYAFIDMLLETSMDIRLNLAIPAYYTSDFVS